MNLMKKVFFPYIPSMVNRLEKWLSQMSETGWYLVDVNGWNFKFIEGDPQYKIYFSYAFFDLSKGISYDVGRARTMYGPRNSNLTDKGILLFEIDVLKIDNDFYEILNLRNTYYKTHYLKLMIFVSILCLLNLPILLSFYALWPLSLVLVCTLVYSLVSLYIISHDSNKVKNHE